MTESNTCQSPEPKNSGDNSSYVGDQIEVAKRRYIRFNNLSKRKAGSKIPAKDCGCVFYGKLERDFGGIIIASKSAPALRKFG
jgi:hypothetical protein